MRQHWGNHLGICVNNADPEKRGRIQVFVPHIMPALFEEWNEDGKDITMECVGDNIPNGLSSSIVERLIKILPWAEAASPIVGMSGGGGSVTSGASIGEAIAAQTGNPVPGVDSSAGVPGAPTQGTVLDQSPTAVDPGNAQPPPSSPGGPIKFSDKASEGKGMSTMPGGTNGNWGGSIQVLSDLLPEGYNYQPSSTKRKYPPPDNSYTNNPNSDHNWAWDNAYGIDLAARTFGSGLTTRGSAAFNKASECALGIWNNIRAQVGKAPYPPGTPWTAQLAAEAKASVVLPSGYRTQLIWWADSGHKNHIHFGVKYQGPTKSTMSESAKPPPVAPSSSKDGGLKASDKTVPANQPSLVGTKSEMGDCPPPAPSTLQSLGGSPAPPGILPGGEGIASTTGGKQTAPTGVSPEAVHYAMRMAAGETGATGNPGSGKSTANYISQVNNTIAMSQGIKNGMEVRGVSFKRIDEIAETLKAQGKVDGTVLDIGYTQHNARDAKAYGIKNSGGYKEQILSVAAHVQKQINKNPAFAAQLAKGDYVNAEYVGKTGPVPGWNTSIYKDTHKANKATLTNRINKEYGGDPMAALDAFDKIYPATDSIETMMGPGYKPPAGGGGGGSDPLACPADPNAPPSETNLANRTSDHGPLVVKNTNDTPNGLFAYPSVGAMIWVFFREGNPLFPVYFAASFGKSEWSGAYKQGSPAPGIAYNGEGPGGGFSHGTEFKPTPAGGISTVYTVNPTDPSKDQKSIMLYADDGSNVFLGTGYNQYFSQHDRIDYVTEDRFNTTMGYKEQWVQGDTNTVIMGDCYIKIGDVSQRAVDAMEQIKKYTEEIQAPLLKSNSPGGGG